MDAVMEYAVPRYRAPSGAPWYHALHGNVPGHEIDFIYCPEVPDGPLTLTHFGHLARLVKYIEPRTGSPFALAIGNLSRDDSQHEPGHGGLALVLGLRVSGVTDGAGRQDPPFAHAIAAIDRDLSGGALLDAALAFLRRVMGGRAAAASSSAFYRAYARCAEERPEDVPGLLDRYVGSFADLPAPQPSASPRCWEVDHGGRPGRLVVVHGDDEPLERVIGVAARLAVVLYRSNVRWTSITIGGDIEIPGGLSIQIVPRSQSAGVKRRLLVPLDEVPEAEEDIARAIFGARPAARPEVRAAPADAGEVSGEREPVTPRAVAKGRNEDEEPTLIRLVPDLVALTARAREEEEEEGSGDEIPVDLEEPAVEAEAVVAAPPPIPAVLAPPRIPAEGSPPPAPAPAWKDVAVHEVVDRAALGLPDRRRRWIVAAGVFLAAATAYWLLAREEATTDSARQRTGEAALPPLTEGKSDDDVLPAADEAPTRKIPVATGSVEPPVAPPRPPSRPPGPQLNNLYLGKPATWGSRERRSP
ncbi:MAG: hypothetical protein IT372_13395 [Polyangiaceae bacterium]|nr:hypothetical protein [Polyangiaceae bacterium]